ncbi:endoribonuclease L-PSP [Lachnospiraceae bacterium WCA-693-APC-MOT-I]|uniref:Endoribonuclease L-PSP n=1 Tax=Velocimicrobium porci TaxID=2606634 RepID=A0A6L5XV51_9FIRM|nr:endoribonuclease L-PSP [Velocimicrobium porci]
MLINKGAKRRIFRWICQVFWQKKWGILIEKESESLIFTGLKIPRDYF